MNLIRRAIDEHCMEKYGLRSLSYQSDPRTIYYQPAVDKPWDSVSIVAISVKPNGRVVVQGKQNTGIAYTTIEDPTCFDIIDRVIESQYEN